MKAVVNRAVCAGFGMCEMIAPILFEVTTQGQARVLMDDIPECLAEFVRTAAAECPMAALTIVY